MKIHILMAQRKQRYDGEYAPEALACFTEIDNDTNPEYLIEETDTARSSKAFDAVEVITLDVDTEEIMNALFPMRTIFAEVIK